MILFIMHCLQKDICIVFEPFPKEIVANFVDWKFGLARDQLCHFTHYMHCLWMLSQRIFAIFVDLAPIGWARDQYVTPLIIWIVFKHCLKEILPFCRSSSDWLSTWPSTLDGVGFFARICNMHAWSVGTISISTICRARDQVREQGSDCLHSRICMIRRVFD